MIELGNRPDRFEPPELLREHIGLLLTDRCAAHAFQLDDEHTWVTEARNAAPPRRILVRIRHDADVEVWFELTGVPGSPFEQLFTVHYANPVDAAAAVVDFVHELLSESRVLVSHGSWRKGRAFVNRIESEALERAEWVASWRGTYDRGLNPQV